MATSGAAKLRFRLLKQKENLLNRTKLVHELTQTVLSYLKKNLSKLSGRTLANTLRSLADLDAVTEDLQKILEDIGEEMRQRPEDFNTLERCMVVGLFASQRLHPGYIINESINRVRSSRGASTCLASCCSVTASGRQEVSDGANTSTLLFCSFCFFVRVCIEFVCFSLIG
jgi:hypothetical protein